MAKDLDNQTQSGLKLWKALLVCLLLLLTAGFVHSFDAEAETEIDKPLRHFPYQIGPWQAHDDLGLTENISAILGVDDYSFRDYYAPQGSSINFYASFFAANTRNKGFHSPLNCMPGSGWNIASTENITLKLPGQDKEVQVRKMLLMRGSEYQVSLYWYQCRSRVIASEYWERFYRVLDSIRYGRTDGAFVRLIATGKENQAQALQDLKDFATQAIPLLEEHLPGV